MEMSQRFGPTVGAHAASALPALGRRGVQDGLLREHREKLAQRARDEEFCPPEERPTG
jgi:hypothetical protein